MKTERVFLARACKLNQLAKAYGVSKRTMKKWLLPFKDEIGAMVGHFYTAVQVEIIGKCLGPTQVTVHF